MIGFELNGTTYYYVRNLQGDATATVSGAAIGAGVSAVKHRTQTGSWEGADKATLLFYHGWRLIKGLWIPFG